MGKSTVLPFPDFCAVFPRSPFKPKGYIKLDDLLGNNVLFLQTFLLHWVLFQILLFSGPTRKAQAPHPDVQESQRSTAQVLGGIQQTREALSSKMTAITGQIQETSGRPQKN